MVGEGKIQDLLKYWVGREANNNNRLFSCKKQQQIVAKNSYLPINIHSKSLSLALEYYKHGPRQLLLTISSRFTLVKCSDFN